MNGDGSASPPWGPADPVPDLDDTQAIPGLGPVPGPNGARSPGATAPEPAARRTTVTRRARVIPPCQATAPKAARAARAARAASGAAASGASFPCSSVVALVLALIIKTFAIQAFFIPSASMENTLEIGDRVLINKVVYHLRSIDRGDIIVFDGRGSWDFDNPTGQHQHLQQGDRRA